MRVLSYNIHKGIGGRDRLYRLHRIMQVIEHERPDLICLQEVARGMPRARREDQAELLAAYFQPADMSYQFNVQFRVGGYGNLILSRWPIVERLHLSLRMKLRKPRGAQLAVVDTPQGPLQLVNTHLGLAEKERHWQLARLLDHCLHPPSELPTLMIGDSNDWRNTLAQGPAAILGLRHVTAPPWRFRSFPAYLPIGSLDKAFCSPSVQVSSVHVAATKLARVASDHLPLVIDFEVRRDEGVNGAW